MTLETLYNVKYYLHDNLYVVGDDSTANGNGITSLQYSGEITILEHVHGKPVTEVCQFAFRECHYITKIFIYAKITKIKEKAFSHCINLEYINIPSSVTFIGLHGLYFGTGYSVVAKPITVEFNKGRTKKLYIDGGSFNFRNNISIIYPYSRSPTFVLGETFFNTENVVICSPKSFVFITKEKNNKP